MVVNTANNNTLITNSVHRIKKMLKPLLRLLSKRNRKSTQKEISQETSTPCNVCRCCTQYTADIDAENAANEALEARLQSAHLAAQTSVNVALFATPYWYPAPDSDIFSECSSYSSFSQTPEQQSPSNSVQFDQEWW